MYKHFLFFSLSFLTACAPKQIMPGAEQIFVGNELPPNTSCQYRGEVLGSQGNFWTAEFTSDKNILTGARNEMRNQALSLGANYVVIQSENNSHNTAYKSLGGTYASVVIGNAYLCSDAAKHS
jgi:hypothetical protein